MTMSAPVVTQADLVRALERIADTEADLRPGHIAYLSKADMIAIARNALSKRETLLIGEVL